MEDTADILALGDTTAVVHTVTLKHPDTKKALAWNGMPITVQVVGVESDEFIESNRENRRILNARAVAGEEYDPAVEDRASFRSLAYCTKGWNNMPAAWLSGERDDPSVLAYSVETAMQMFERLGWLRRQIREAVEKSENFRRAS